MSLDEKLLTTEFIAKLKIDDILLIKQQSVRLTHNFRILILEYLKAL